MDVGRFLRLQGAVRAAAGAISEDHAVVGADAMMQSYQRLRGEVRIAIPPEDVDEFDRVCPPNVPSFATPPYGVPIAQADKFHAARGLLEQMAGWLEGYVRHAEMQANAEAYAAERVRQERVTGFRP